MREEIRHRAKQMIFYDRKAYEELRDSILGLLKFIKEKEGGIK